MDVGRSPGLQVIALPGLPRLVKSSGQLEGALCLQLRGQLRIGDRLKHLSRTEFPFHSVKETDEEIYPTLRRSCQWSLMLFSKERSIS